MRFGVVKRGQLITFCAHLDSTFLGISDIYIWNGTFELNILNIWNGDVYLDENI